MDELRVPRTQYVMLGAGAGFLVAFAVIYFDRHWWSKETRDFLSSGAFLLWGGLITAQTMLWLLALVPLWSTFRRHIRAEPETSLRREAVPAAVLLFALVATLLIVPQLTNDIGGFLPHRRLKIDVLTGLAMVSVVVAAMAIWVIRARLEALSQLQEAGARELETYLGLRGDLEKLLGFLGAVIGLAVFAAAALRHLALLWAEHEHRKIDFPAEAVVLYGLILTVLLALVYLPTFATLRQTGSKLRDLVEPFPDPKGNGFDAAVKKRATLDDLLGLRVSATTHFRAGVAILSPLLGGLTSLLPKLGG